jgi:hypothetical protein
MLIDLDRPGREYRSRRRIMRGSAANALAFAAIMNIGDVRASTPTNSMPRSTIGAPDP